MSWELLEETNRIISIHSITYESNREIVDHLCKLLEPLNMQIERQKGELYGKEQFNLIARKGPREGSELLFNTHLDTVSPGNFSLWDKTGGNPFRATVIDDKIYGLGTADAKLDMLCKIKALEKFSEQTFKNPFVLVGTYGEESGLSGAKKLVEENKVRPRYAVVGEPSNLSIVYAHKGHLVFEIKLTDREARMAEQNLAVSRIDFFGKVAHSSTPHLGVNAIQKALDFLRRFKGQFQLIRLQGGGLINVIPDRASLWIYPQENFLPTEMGESGAQLAVESLREKAFLFSDHFLNCFEEVQNCFKKMAHEFKRSPMVEFDPPFCLLVIGAVETEENRICLRAGIRTLPSMNTDELVHQLRTHLDEIWGKFPSVEGIFSVLRESVPMKTDLDSTLVSEARNVLREMGLQDTVVTKATSTEASVYRQLGAESIVWGPGVSLGNVHCPNEFNYIHHLKHAVRFYERMIAKFCL